MSYTATKWAYDLPLSGSAKGILVALADMADEANSCYPGQEKLAAMTGRSVKTVERALKFLERVNLLVRVHRHGAQGWRTSDRYELQIHVLMVDLPDNLPTSQNAHKAESLKGNLSGLPDNLSSPTRQGDGAEENHQYESPEEPSSSETAVTDIVRTDVEELCSLLRDSVLSNGVRKTQAVITDGWRSSARLLLDRDHVPLAEARRVLLWSQSDSFWSQNILSMPKFREKFDQLALKSKNVSGSSALERNLARLAAMRAQEAAS